MRLAFIFALCLTSCGRHSEDYYDIGTVCLDDDVVDTGHELTIGEGDTVRVTVILDRCAASSTTWMDESCELLINGQQIEVSTSGRREWGNYTTKDCWDKVQECGEVTLGAGDWTLVYGGADASLTVPYEGSRFCVTSVDSSRHN